MHVLKYNVKLRLLLHLCLLRSSPYVILVDARYSPRKAAVEANDIQVSVRATILLGELLNMSALLLHPSYSARYNTLAELTLASTAKGCSVDLLLPFFSCECGIEALRFYLFNSSYEPTLRLILPYELCMDVSKNRLDSCEKSSRARSVARCELPNLLTFISMFDLNH